MTISSASNTRESREREVVEAIHSGEMEGVFISEAARKDSDDYIAGRIDSEELIARAESRYGLR